MRLSHKGLGPRTKLDVCMIAWLQVCHFEIGAENNRTLFNANVFSLIMFYKMLCCVSISFCAYLSFLCLYFR